MARKFKYLKIKKKFFDIFIFVKKNREMKTENHEDSKRKLNFEKIVLSERFCCVGYQAFPVHFKIFLSSISRLIQEVQ